MELAHLPVCRNQTMTIHFCVDGSLGATLTHFLCFGACSSGQFLSNTLLLYCSDHDQLDLGAVLMFCVFCTLKSIVVSVDTWNAHSKERVTLSWFPSIYLLGYDEIKKLFDFWNAAVHVM